MPGCKICKSKTIPIIDFGKMPIANAFLKNIKQKEYQYRLSIDFCPKCYMVQLGNTVPPKLLFNNHYSFISMTSRNMESHFQIQAEEIIRRIKNKNNPFVIELGSNDGIMLRHIAKKGIKHLGIDPAKNVADMSKKYDVNTITDFFDQKLAKKIVKKYGQADVICGSNVTCHIENINSVVRGISILLKRDGLWFFEDPYIYDIVKKSSFDQIYDEHVYYYSGLSVTNLVKKHGLKLVDMKHQDVHGGSMRYYIVKDKSKNITGRMKKYIENEKKIKLHLIKGYHQFRNNVNKVCYDFRKLLDKIKSQGERIIGYGATSKSTTILNYTKIGSKLIEYISDTTPTKINRYTPGMHIPVKDYIIFKKDTIKYVVLFAWNHKREIFAKESRFRKNGGKFITFFPKVKIE